jgi:hypothetical protein
MNDLGRLYSIAPKIFIETHQYVVDAGMNSKPAISVYPDFPCCSDILRIYAIKVFLHYLKIHNNSIILLLCDNGLERNRF